VMTADRKCCAYHSNGLKRYLVGVAITLTTAILGQSMVLVWWAATITTRVDRTERDVSQLTVRVHTLETER